MTNIKIYQICHNLITYFVTLTSPKKVIYVLYLGPEGVLSYGQRIENAHLIVTKYIQHLIKIFWSKTTHAFSKVGQKRLSH